MTPRPPVVAPDVLRVAFGDPAPVVERGQQVGSVTVESAVYRPTSGGVEAAAGRRWLRVSLTFRATAALTYEGGRWSVLDANGKRHRWTRAGAPDPALGAGTLDAGRRRTGYLVFSVPSDVADQVPGAPGRRRPGYRGARSPVIRRGAPGADAHERPILRA